MADEHGKPIAPPLAPSPPAHAPANPDAPKGCLACGQYHGSIGVRFACLEREIVRLRRLLTGGGR